MRELVLPAATAISAEMDLAGSLALAKSRVAALEAFRIKRLLHNSDLQFQSVFSLIPALVHYNHPMLVGYVENAPCGLYQFKPSFEQQQQLANLVVSSLDSPSKITFDALYVMGSLGSITQNRFSDIDLWLCYSQDIDEAAQQCLDQKLALIKQWALQQGVVVHFYLMNPQEFRAREYGSEITPEHSGSAQHYLLLDEFYRSAIRLAGKPILWLHLLEQGKSYEQTVQQAVADKLIDLNEWVDFGDFADVELSEYFGASLWQLYKGINNPYKSAIKILLLESYAQAYPQTNLIARQFKRLLLSKQAVNFHFDPYLAMLQQVTDYLTHRHEFKRLECLRYCFYIKAMDGQQDDWKRQELRELATLWGWSDKERLLLENRAEWKIKQAMQHQKMLVEQLLRSYRNLINFARKFHIDPSIMPQDTDILMRKLYSVFEIFPGKVELINEKIASNLSEHEVTFIEVLKDNESTKAGWYLVNHAPLSAYDSNKRYVQYQKTLNKLVAWAYFNGIVTVNTQLNIVSQTVSLARLRQFIADLRLSFPAKAPKMSDSDLYHPNEIRHLIVAVNLTHDPTKKWRTRRPLSQIDLLNLSSSEQSIIGSISIIYRNMWNEIITHHLEGNEAILKALKLISNKIYRSFAPPQSVNVFCYAAQLRDELQKFVIGLVNRCISVQTGTVSEKQSGIFKLADKKWQFVFNQQIELKACTQEIETKLSNAMLQSLSVPKIIYSFASEGFLQFFFEDNIDGSFNVYVLDKDNQTEIYIGCSGKKEDKIKKISRLYAEDEQNQADDISESFNYPQFYQLIHLEQHTAIVPFKSKQHRDYLTQSVKTL